MCACESTTQSTVFGSIVRLRFLSNASLRWPWKSPQSRRMRFPFASTRCIEPVVVWAAPWKEIRIPPPQPNLTGSTPQMLRAYSITARSDENRPERAMLTSDIRFHFFASRYVASTRSCASE